ncbi:MAG TPA: chemotaxis protein CheA, partial [Sporichthya sp.]|nr:chemotaxis protein CheA [Sporichthya sp.]
IESTGVEGDIDVEAVQLALAACLEPSEETAPVEPSPLDPAPRAEGEEDTVTETETEAEAVTEAVTEAGPVTEEAVTEAAPVAEVAAAPTPFPGRCEPSDQSACGFEPVTIEISPAFESEDGTEESGRRSVADSSIRVDVGLLDQLMRMVGELVLTRNQVVQYVGDLQHTELQRASQRLNLIATELQEGVMKTRMQPIDQVWSRLPRVVRDLGAQVGKQVRLTMDGRETELDRTLLEAVKDPLTHLVRNAIDHGLETPEGRVAAGKPVEGTLSLRAYHEGGQVVVEVGDDGRGIDPARVGAKALENGIVNRDQLQRMSEREIADLVFRPGFSTATAVSNISGRGVGMDVVRTNIEKIGGTVDLVSEVGVGTTVRVRIPLTLAIIPALVVGQAGDTYAIPQANLLELVRLEGEAAMASIEHVAGAPVYRLRGTLLPLVYLDAQLGLPSPEEREALNIVVLAADNTHFGLIVDRILDTQEIVVRPLSRQIKHVEAFAGATITGDGKVALILDVAGLAQRATHQAAAGVTRRNDTERAQASETTRLLICQVGSDRRLALPMTDVARLEEFAVTDVEKAGSAEVVQYRGDLLRLVHVGPLLGMGSGPGDAENYMVVVHRHEDESAVGLVVDRILDVIEEEIALSNVGARRGLAGSAVLQQRVTDIVDVPALVAAAQSA